MSDELQVPTDSARGIKNESVAKNSLQFVRSILRKARVAYKLGRRFVSFLILLTSEKAASKERERGGVSRDPQRTSFVYVV